jgi:hypothetical protein
MREVLNKKKPIVKQKIEKQLREPFVVVKFSSADRKREKFLVYYRPPGKHFAPVRKMPEDIVILDGISDEKHHCRQACGQKSFLPNGLLYPSFFVHRCRIVNSKV